VHNRDKIIFGYTKEIFRGKNLMLGNKLKKSVRGKTPSNTRISAGKY